MFWPGGHCATRAGHEHLPPRVREEGQGNWYHWNHGRRILHLRGIMTKKKREDLIAAISVRRLPCHSHSQVRWLVERQATMYDVL